MKSIWQRIWDWTPFSKGCETDSRPLTREQMTDAKQMLRSASSGAAYPVVTAGKTDPGSDMIAAAKAHIRRFPTSKPTFRNPDEARRWSELQRKVMNHVFQLMATSRWAENLVLRGSLLMQAWFGDAARQPNDIDWVVTPQTHLPTDAWTTEMFQDLVKIVADAPVVENASIAIQEACITDIWSYAEIPGRRMLIPWDAPRLPSGFVQIDFVFGEELWGDPFLVDFPIGDGSRIAVRSATPEMVLAWKIFWLHPEQDPRGKDLYDATLLAERVQLPYHVLNRVFQQAEGNAGVDVKPDFCIDWHLDWATFKHEYPQIPGHQYSWLARLSTALRKSFNGREQS